ncbi:MAG: hypothetical protein JW928_00830, partial [Candidatus Aureabacteria bacterium]|nr:hypothetical protein [Candidatus Auribacterota bacterium]
MRKKKKKKNVSRILLKTAFASGLILLSVLLIMTLYSLFLEYGMNLMEEFRFILIGILIYFALHLFVRRRPVIYIIGHELTHMIFVWLFHGWAWKLKIRKNQGSITASKDNLFISLAPYFFPLFTIFLLIIYIFSITFVKNNLTFSILQTIIGITTGFHFLFTAEMILSQQNDFNYLGRALSVVLIISFNMLNCIMLLLIFSGLV